MLLKKSVSCFFLLMFLSYYGMAQSMAVDSSIAESSKNRIEVTTSKVGNVFHLHGTADLLFSGSFGEFTLRQNYHGNAHKKYTTTIRSDTITTADTVVIEYDTVTAAVVDNWDSEELLLSWSYPLTDYLSLMINQKNTFLTDNISNGTNDLSRISSQLGFILRSGNNMYLNFCGGLEDNKNLGIRNGAGIYTVNGYARNLEVFEMRVNTTLTGELLQIDDNRQFADVGFQADMFKNYENSGLIALSLKYKKQKRDLIVAQYISGSDYPFDSRNEDRISGDFRMGFQVLDHIFSNFSIALGNQTVGRRYSRAIEGLNQSYLRKNQNIFNLKFAGSLEYKIDNFLEAVSLSYESEDKRHRISNIYGLDKTAEADMRNLENQMDYVATVSRFSSKTVWRASSNDTLHFDYNMLLSRKDTPSDENDEEQDALSAFFNLNWTRYFSRNFTAAFNADLQMNHQVYLKSSQSAGNYRLNVLRLAPEFRWRTDWFTLNPVFEILANYMVYDYEDTTAIKSRSMRQISYRDTVFIPLETGYSIQAGLAMKYYESGKILWSSFAEAPESSNFEQYVRTLIVKNFSARSYLGFGVKYYQLDYRKISGSRSFSTSNVESFGLETVMNFQLFNNSNISLQGWYEFQKVKKDNKKEYNSFPNFFILTTIYL